MNYDIDLVYLWVNGNDPEWQLKRNAFIGKVNEDSSINCKGRYVNNDELKYSMRSIDLYAPWLRKIFIVTDNQVPEWLDTSNPKIQIVDHSEILPPESRPCFNSSLIEHFIYRIPGLSEHFLFSNDDTFLNKHASPEDFFTPQGFPIVRLTRMPFRKIRWFFRENVRNRPLGNYTRILGRSSQLVYDKYGHYYTGLPHHNIDSYLKSDYKRMVEEVFRDEFMANNTNRMRNDNDVHRSVISYATLAEKRAKRRYVNKKESLMVKIHRARHFIRLDKYRPMFFCINDSEFVRDEHRIKAKEYMQTRFPDKSSFEK